MDTNYTCITCGLKFTYKHQLKTHIRTHTGEKPLACKICASSFSNNTDMKRHMLLKHPEETTKAKTYPCMICGSQFGKRSQLKQHVRTHTEEEQPTCQVCGKQFKTDANRKRHMVLHTKETTCLVCGEVFTLRTLLEEHVKTHNHKQSIWDVCEEQLSFESSREGHMTVHAEEKPFSCLVCDERFSQSSLLIWHVESHTDGKSICNVCGKTVCDDGSLRRHMRTHTGEKPYSCQVCGESFSDRTSKKRHERRHT